MLGWALEALPTRWISWWIGRIWMHRIVPEAQRIRRYTRFAARYQARLDEVAGELTDFETVADFFQRSLRPGARPIASTDLVVPCDGRVVSSGLVRAGQIPQVKGIDYQVAELVGDAELARRLEGGSQLTVYLAPGDYHRVHAPFHARMQRRTDIPGRWFPVRRFAQRLLPRLFVRNARVVIECRLEDGRAAAVVLVGALCVRDIRIDRQTGPIRAGEEIGRFGFGSTVVVLVASGGAVFREFAAGTRLLVGEAAAIS